MKFDEAVQVMDSFYAEGGRCLYLEGGEPFIWKDHSHAMEDIVLYAKKRGYLAVIIYTNGDEMTGRRIWTYAGFMKVADIMHVAGKTRTVLYARIVVI